MLQREHYTLERWMNLENCKSMTQKIKWIVTSIVLCYHLGSAEHAMAQEFMMQGWYWDYPKGGACGAPGSWAGNLSSKAAELGSACFTHVWLPPSSRASFGSCSNGYDPKDLYDLGEFGLGPTGLGTRAEVNGLIAALNANGINAIADVVFNHRDGGDWEVNPAVRDYVINYPFGCGSATPYPVNGKARYALPLGGASGNGAGDYYFKLSSSSANTGFNGRSYKVYFETNTVGWQAMADQSESEPNGGGDCGEPNDQVQLGINFNCTQEVGGSCNTDEFYLNLQVSDFNPVGDMLYMVVEEIGGGGTGIDIRPYGIWSTSAGSDIINQLNLETRTDFSAMPSGQGAMNYTNFKPNGTDPTCLTGDIDFPFFFFDVEENTSATVYSDWASWLHISVGYNGIRMDAVKHMETGYVSQILANMAGNGVNPSIVVGEFFDTNAGVLKGWSDATGSMVFDFNMRQALKDACDAFGYDVRNVFNSGIVNGAGGTGFQTVTFVNNHDYRSAGEPVQNDPMLAYAYILTNNQIGLPCVFYPDYFGDAIPNAPTVQLKNEINALMAFHKSYIFQSNTADYLSRISTPYSASYTSGFPNTSLIYQLSGGVGGKEVVVAINFAGEPLEVTHGLNMTNLSTGENMMDMLGTSNNANTPINAGGQMYMNIPARSYAVFANCAALPLDLISFDVEKGNSNNRLEWVTANEDQVSHFAVERSLDGTSWNEIAKLTARNTPEENYQFMDRDVNFKTLYYRLKIVDFDGSFEYSGIQTVTRSVDTDIQIFPNPTRDRLNVIGKNIAKLSIIDITGKVQIQQAYSDPILRLDELNSGIYFIQLYGHSDQLIKVQKLMKN